MRCRFITREFFYCVYVVCPKTEVETGESHVQNVQNSKQYKHVHIRIASRTHANDYHSTIRSSSCLYLLGCRQLIYEPDTIFLWVFTFLWVFNDLKYNCFFVISKYICTGHARAGRAYFWPNPIYNLKRKLKNTVLQETDINQLDSWRKEVMFFTFTFSLLFEAEIWYLLNLPITSFTMYWVSNK